MVDMLFWQTEFVFVLLYSFTSASFLSVTLTKYDLSVTLTKYDLYWNVFVFVFKLFILLTQIEFWVIKTAVSLLIFFSSCFLVVWFFKAFFVCCVNAWLSQAQAIVIFDWRKASKSVAVVTVVLCYFCDSYFFVLCLFLFLTTQVGKRVR